MDNETMQKRLGLGFGSGARDIMAAAEGGHTPLPEPSLAQKPDLEEEEL
jgi:hypothetical protein